MRTKATRVATRLSSYDRQHPFTLAHIPLHSRSLLTATYNYYNEKFKFERYYSLEAAPQAPIITGQRQRPLQVPNMYGYETGRHGRMLHLYPAFLCRLYHSGPR